MAETLVKGVMTEEGIRKIDYTALANLPVIDTALSKSSTNAVQNKAVYAAVNNVETKLNTEVATINSKFTASGAAANSEKLGGQSPSYYATAAAVQAAQSTADGKAPIAHASSANTYGIGTNSNYGHVKLSDSTNSTSKATAGVAASPQAVKDAYDLASTGITNAAAAQATADAAMPKSNLTFKVGSTAKSKLSMVFNSDTGVLDITLG